MNANDIAYMRLTAQHIAAPTLSDPVEVVRYMGAVQAQDYGQALWAVGLRTKGATKQIVERAVADGAILRTWPMRGTIHFVPAEDASWMLAISAERAVAANKSRRTQLGITDTHLKKALDVAKEALDGRTTILRTDLVHALEARGLDVSDQRGYHMLWYWSQLGELCIGPLQGKQPTYALLRTWTPHQRELSREEGMVELARRYFISHGPATLADFCTWASMLKTEATHALEQLKSELERTTVDGVEYWFAPHLTLSSSERLHDSYLLAGFEEYLLGYKNRSAVLPTAFTVTPYKNGIFFPIMVHDGQVVGTWKRVVGSKSIAVRFEPFVPLSAELHERFVQKAHHYGEFIDLPIALTN